MGLNYLWESLHSIASLTGCVLMISLVFGWVGFVVLTTLRTGVKLEVFSSISVAAGLGVALPVAWYLFRLGFSMIVCINVLMLSSMVGVFCYAAGIVFRNHPVSLGSLVYDNVYKLSVARLLIVSIVLSAYRMILFHRSGISIGGYGNPDFYSWSAVADELVGRFTTENISGAVSPMKTWFITDVFGTGFVMAVFGMFTGKLAVESTPYFMITVLAWTTLVIDELARRILGIRGWQATLIALLVVCSAFYNYVALQSFFGQLVGIFGFLSILLAANHLVRPEFPEASLKRVGFVLPAVVATLVAYPAGFVVFLAVSCFAMMMLGMAYWWDLGVVTSLRTSVLRLLVPLLLSCIGLVAFVPEMAVHCYNRTIVVASALNGWPLPSLVSPYILFGIPMPFRIPKLYVKPSAYISALTAYSLVLSMCWYRLKRLDRQFAYIIVSMSAVYIVLVLMYILAFLIKGSTYQVWKFASYAIMPLGFVTLGTAIIFIHSILDCIQDRVKCFTYAHKHIVILAVCCLCVYGVCCFGSEQGRWLVRQNDKIERLKALRTDLKSTERVVVDLGPYGHTMLAFNVLSRDHLLFPTSLTYMAPAILTEAELLPGKASWLTFSDCKAVMERAPYELARTSKGSLDAHYVVMQPDKTVGAFRFWLEDGGCMLCRELKTSGLADPDTWGRWSADRSVTMVYEIPPVLRGSALRFSFKVLPYVSSRIDFQNVFVAIQDMHYSNIELRHLDFVKIDVPAQQTFDSHIVFRFDLPDASVAENDGALSCDGRLLAVKFIDLAVERI